MSMLRVIAVAVVTVGFFVIAMVGPLIAHLNRRIRDPTEAEDELIETYRSGVGPRVPRRKVVITVGEASVDATIRGPPGYRVLFITDHVLHELDPSIARPLVAAAFARRATWYDEYRVVASTVAIALGMATVTLLLPFELGMAGLILAALVMFAVGRWLQYRADDIAADAVGSSALVEAFEAIANVHDIDLTTGGMRRYLDVQPSLGDRVARLNKRGE